MTTENKTDISDAKDIFICDCHEDMHLACKGEGFFKEHEGKRYCVLHYPGKDKIEAFRAALKRKLDARDFDFKGVWFPEKANFRDFYFSEGAKFSLATFSGDASFAGVTFSGYASFEGVTFSGDASFAGATFSGQANFMRATFSGSAHFTAAALSGGAFFMAAAFSGSVRFGRVTFSEYAIFSGAAFSGSADFGLAAFSGSADFLSATFNGVANFSTATFSGSAHFSGAAFSEYAIFSGAAFNGVADFSGATFSGSAHFMLATFSGSAHFRRAAFSEFAIFSEATFKSYVSFTGSDVTSALGETHSLNFQFAHIETPEHISFHSLYMRPHWFINIDCRKFEFTNIEWNFNLKEELISSSDAKISAPHRLLAIAYRQLADNAEANHLYHEASRFRYNAFEAQRVEKFRGLVPWRLDFWYWLASGYGERVGQAFLVFVALIALFAFGYSKVGFKQEIVGTTGQPAISQQKDVFGKPLEWKDALVYSAYVSILQKPEPKPLTFAAQSLVWAETILGPAQAALLALAIRRRFMR